MKALHVVLPVVKGYNAWQPWVKGYYGESDPRYLVHLASVAEYVWIDRNLKETMTGRR